MSSDGVAENTEELPSTIGSGWFQISVDDPQIDKQLIINNLVRELSITDQQARQNYKNTAERIELHDDIC